jgi:small subunit ribosomal protein S4
LVKPGDVVSVCEKSKAAESIKSVLEKNASRPVPKWMECNNSAFEAKVVAKAERGDIDLEVEETLIIELYSK